MQVQDLNIKRKKLIDDDSGAAAATTTADISPFVHRLPLGTTLAQDEEERQRRQAGGLVDPQLGEAEDEQKADPNEVGDRKDWIDMPADFKPAQMQGGPSDRTYQRIRSGYDGVPGEIYSGVTEGDERGDIHKDVNLSSGFIRDQHLDQIKKGDRVYYDDRPHRVKSMTTDFRPKRQGVIGSVKFEFVDQTAPPVTVEIVS